MGKGKVYATRDLLRAQASGKTIVCAVEPYDGYAVRYDPRKTGDPVPWVLPKVGRFKGTECVAANTGRMI